VSEGASKPSLWPGRPRVSIQSPQQAPAALTDLPERRLPAERDSLGPQSPEQFEESRFIEAAITIGILLDDKADLLAWMQRDQGDLRPIGISFTL